LLLAENSVQIEKELKSLVALAKSDPDQVSVCETGSDEANAANSETSVQVIVQEGVEAYLPLSGLIDPVKERARLIKQREKLSNEIEKLAGRLNFQGFYRQGSRGGRR
jgi:valyl-tRNA synthetase